MLGHSLGGVVHVYDQHDYLDEQGQAYDAWYRMLQKIVGGNSAEPRKDNVVELRGRKIS